jgi:hypothetical protein
LYRAERAFLLRGFGGAAGPVGGGQRRLSVAQRLRQLLDPPAVPVRVLEEHIALVVERVVGARGPRRAAGDDQDLDTSTPRSASSSRVARRSGTTSCTPLSEPGAICPPCDISMIEQPDPGGVSWTTLKSSLSWASVSTLNPSLSA